MPASLNQWLQRLEQRTGSAIELGLERVSEVARALELDFSGVPVVTVAGTNGKGSVIGYLETLYCAAGYRTFAYTSPHLLKFSERIRLNGTGADDAMIADALTRVEAARGQTRLTYFEQTTLAGLLIADETHPDVVLLEVGLGGRLDAVNIVDADVAVISSIGLDHLEWLGPDRNAVAREKAGIARAGRPLIVGDNDPPPGLEAAVAAIGADCRFAGRDFDWQVEDEHWRLRLTLQASPEYWSVPAMTGTHQLANAACARLAAEVLRQRLPFAPEHFAVSVANTQLAGRFQSLRTRPEIILDVGHNVQAAQTLSEQLAARIASGTGRVLAVFAMLADKDVAGVAGVLDDQIHTWFVAGLGGARGNGVQKIAAILRDVPVQGGVEALESVSRALDRARQRAGPEDMVLVFGSFRTVAEALMDLQTE